MAARRQHADDDVRRGRRRRLGADRRLRDLRDPDARADPQHRDRNAVARTRVRRHSRRRVRARGRAQAVHRARRPVLDLDDPGRGPAASRRGRGHPRSVSAARRGALSGSAAAPRGEGVPRAVRRVPHDEGRERRGPPGRDLDRRSAPAQPREAAAHEGLHAAVRGQRRRRRGPGPAAAVGASGGTGTSRDRVARTGTGSAPPDPALARRGRDRAGAGAT